MKPSEDQQGFARAGRRAPLNGPGRGLCRPAPESRSAAPCGGFAPFYRRGRRKVDDDPIALKARLQTADQLMIKSRQIDQHGAPSTAFEAEPVARLRLGHGGGAQDIEAYLAKLAAIGGDSIGHDIRPQRQIALFAARSRQPLYFLFDRTADGEDDLDGDMRRTAHLQQFESHGPHPRVFEPIGDARPAVRRSRDGKSDVAQIGERRPQRRQALFVNAMHRRHRAFDITEAHIAGSYSHASAPFDLGSCQSRLIARDMALTSGEKDRGKPVAIHLTNSEVMASVSRKRTATKSPTLAKPRVFISGDLEPPRWARSAAWSTSWRETLLGCEEPRRVNHLCDVPRSPVSPAWRQGFDVDHVVECERFTFLGPWQQPYGLTPDEREMWRHASLRRLQSADAMFVRFGAGGFDGLDDARRIADEIECAAKFNVPIFAHEGEREQAPEETTILRKVRRLARRTTSAPLTVDDAFAETLLRLRDERLRSRASKRRAA